MFDCTVQGRNINIICWITETGTAATHSSGLPFPQCLTFRLSEFPLSTRATE